MIKLQQKSNLQVIGCLVVMFLSVLYDLIIYREPNYVSITLILKAILLVFMSMLVYQQLGKKIAQVIHEKCYPIHGISMSPNQDLFVTVGLNSDINIFEIRNKSSIANKFSSQNNIISCVEYLNKNEFIVAGSQRIIEFYNIELNKMTRTISNAHDQLISSLSISMDLKYLVSAGLDKKIKIWNLQDLSLFQLIDAHNQGVEYVLFYPNSLSFVSSSRDNLLKKWSINQEKFGKYEVQNECSHVLNKWMVANYMSFTPDGDKICLVGPLRHITILSASNQLKPLKVIYNAHWNEVSVVMYSKSGLQIFSGDKYGTFKIWDSSRFTCQFYLNEHKDLITCISQSKGEDFILLGYDGGQIRNHVTIKLNK